MALGIVGLEKAFDTVPREMVIATLRWMGVPEAEVRMVEGTYEKTTARVVVGEGASEEFEVKIRLDSFVYLGGAVCGDGKMEREVRRRMQAGANGWRAVGG